MRLRLLQMQKNLKILYFFFFVSCLAHAQQYYFEKFSVAQGLSQASVYSIAEDRVGNLWFATESGGLDMYDGNFVSHRYLSDGLPDENIRTLYEDSKGRLWIGTANGGACFLFNGKYTVLNIDSGLSDNAITSITEDINGGIWIGTKYNGLNLYENDKIIHLGRIDGLLSDEITALFEDKNGLLFIATRRGLNFINRKDGNTIKALPNLNGIHVSCAVSHGANSFLIGTNQGIFSLSTDFRIKKIEIPFVENKLVNCIYRDVVGNFWAGTNHGLLKFTKNQADDEFSCTLYDESNGLSNNQVKCIFQDRSGAIWIGTKFGGVNKFIGEKFVSLAVNDGLSEQFVTAVCALKDLSTAYGTFSNGITIKKGNQLIHLDDPQLTSSAIRSMVEDNNGRLWIGTEGNGLFNYHKGKLNLFNDHITANEVNVLFKDTHGNIWIGTNNRGLRAIFFENRIPIYTELSSLVDIENLSILSITEDHSGDLWACSSGGIIQISNTKNINQDKLVPKVHQVNVLAKNTTFTSCFAEINSEKVWFGTQSKGLCFLFRNKFYVFPNNSLLNDVVINSMCINKAQLWLGTNKDIKVIDLSNFDVQNFSFKDGFEGIQCNKGAISLDYKENLWVGTLNGAYKINIKESSPIPANFTPSLHLTQIKYNFKEFDWTPYCDSLWGFYKIPNRLELPYNINHLTFTFNAKGLIHPENIEYKFQLVGHDEAFSPPSKISEITYTNLEPGEYEFLVFSRLKGSSWNNEPTSLHVLIHSPFWKTLWFRTSIVIFIILSIFLFFKWRTRRLENEKKILENLVHDRTKDLAAEKHKSEKLLLNILPEEIAAELKVSGTAKTKLYNSASVMFTDFKGFTSLSGQLTPEVLVQELNSIFNHFDDISDRHKLEKIKTIGDSYMCAGGIPVENKSHALNCVLAGLEFIEFMKTFETSIGQTWEVRVGIHSGPIIAGVVGKKKFAYDIWGDSVNVASRMESNGEPGRLNISQSTYNLIKDYFICTPRGEVHVKNKGEMTMYFVDRLKPQYSADDKGFVANEAFKNYLG